MVQQWREMAASSAYKRTRFWGSIETKSCRSVAAVRIDAEKDRACHFGVTRRDPQGKRTHVRNWPIGTPASRFTPRMDRNVLTVATLGAAVNSRVTNS